MSLMKKLIKENYVGQITLCDIRYVVILQQQKNWKKVVSRKACINESVFYDSL